MKEVEQIEARLYQDIIEVRDYVTQNSWGEHSNLNPGEYRKISNVEIYNGYIKSRRGSKFLRPDGGATRAESEFIKQSIVWDVGELQYLIYSQDNRFYYQAVGPDVAGNPIQIRLFDGINPFLIGSAGDTSQPDFVLEGGRLYIFHTLGNGVIEYEDNLVTFQGRTMGMIAPKIDSISQPFGGVLFGLYTYGIEKVYQKNGGDFLASSPNRFKVDRLLATTDNIPIDTPATFIIDIDPTELENDSLWTHIRLWRSKSQVTDNSDPLSPIDPGGVPEELYEVALATRAEMLGAGAPLTTSTDNLLPAGNINTEAGQPGGVGTNFQMFDNSDDDYLSLLIGLEEIDLQPLPRANLGATHGNRIYIGDLGTNILSDGSKISEDRLGNVFYSNLADSAYGEQFKASNVVPLELDGQNVTKLITFEKELFIIKEAKTIRLQNGDNTLPVEVLDQRIGTPNKDFLEFIPTLGICGRTNDYGDFRILGFDFVWRSTFNGIDISKPIRNEMNTLIAGETSIIYINGKLMIGDSDGNAYVLNVEQGKGWSQFKYRSTNTDQYFTFADNSRAGIVGADEYGMEIEVENLDTDVDMDTELEGNPITCRFITHQFRVNDGAAVLEHEWLSIMAKLTSTCSAIPYGSSVAWPNNLPVISNFVNDPSLYNELQKLNDREHRLFIAPQPQGIFLWNRFISNFLHYDIFTDAPCIFKVQKLHVIVDEDGIAWGDFDPYQILPDITTVFNIIETGTADDTFTETGTADTNILEVP